MARPGQQEITTPIILSLELSGLCGSVALVCPGLCLAEYSLHSRQTHSQRLITVINRLLADCGKRLTDIDALAVSLGPGSFTGLRIALATVKGLAMASGLKVIGVASLDGLAAQLPYCQHPICPVIDARKQQVYTSIYRCDGQGIARQQEEYLAIKPEHLAERITEPTLFLGDGTAVYGDILKQQLGELALFAPSAINFPRAASIGLLALDKFAKGDFLESAIAEPLYVRPSDAELNFQKGKTKFERG